MSTLILTYLAYPLGLEPRLTVLETAMLPLHYGYIIGGRRRSRTPSLLREPGFQGQSADHPTCIIFLYLAPQDGIEPPTF